MGLDERAGEEKNYGELRMATPAAYTRSAGETGVRRLESVEGVLLVVVVRGLLISSGAAVV